MFHPSCRCPSSISTARLIGGCERVLSGSLQKSSWSLQYPASHRQLVYHHQSPGLYLSPSFLISFLIFVFFESTGPLFVSQSCFVRILFPRSSPSILLVGISFLTLPSIFSLWVEEMLVRLRVLMFTGTRSAVGGECVVVSLSRQCIGNTCGSASARLNPFAGSGVGEFGRTGLRRIPSLAQLSSTLSGTYKTGARFALGSIRIFIAQQGKHGKDGLWKCYPFYIRSSLCAVASN